MMETFRICSGASAKYDGGLPVHVQSMDMKPSKILYTRDSISDRFDNGTSVTDTLEDMLCGAISYSALPPIEVFRYEGYNWYVYDGNRRLWIFKRLQQEGRIDTIPVVQVQVQHPESWTGSGNEIKMVPTVPRANNAPMSGCGLRPVLTARKDIPTELDNIMSTLEGSMSKLSVGKAAPQEPADVHCIFCIDMSASMATQDVSGNKGRWHTVLDTVHEILELQLAAGPTNDMVSLIFFNDFADDCTSKLNKDALRMIREVQEKVTPKGGTSYKKAFNALEKVILKTPAKENLVVLLSDGRPGDHAGLEICQQMQYSDGYNFVLHTVGFGPDSICDDERCSLVTIAQAGNGQFHDCTNLDPTVLTATFHKFSAQWTKIRTTVTEGRTLREEAPELETMDDAWRTEKENYPTFETCIIAKPPAHYKNQNMRKEGASFDVRIAPKPFSLGSMREAFHVFNGEDEHFIAKESRFNETDKDRLQVYVRFLEMHQRAAAMAEEFNKRLEAVGITTKCSFVDSRIYRVSDSSHKRGQRYLFVEDFLEGKFVKYNDNAQFVLPSSKAGDASELAQAFSHFTYEYSEGKEMCVDIQGVDLRWTDPQFHSVDTKYGDADCGKVGMRNFFSTHELNDTCKKLGLKMPNLKDL